MASFWCWHLVGLQTRYFIPFCLYVEVSAAAWQPGDSTYWCYDKRCDGEKARLLASRAQPKCCYDRLENLLVCPDDLRCTLDIEITYSGNLTDSDLWSISPTTAGFTAVTKNTKAWIAYGSTYVPFLSTVIVIPFLAVLLVCIYHCRKTKVRRERFLSRLSREHGEGITTTAAHQPPGYTEVEIPLWVTRASDSDNYTDVESQDQPPEYEQVTAGVLGINTSAAARQTPNSEAGEQPPPYNIAIKHNNNDVVFSTV